MANAAYSICFRFALAHHCIFRKRIKHLCQNTTPGRVNTDATKNRYSRSTNAGERVSGKVWKDRIKNTVKRKVPKKTVDDTDEYVDTLGRTVR